MIALQTRFCDCSFFFFKQKTAYEMRISDWSSDVCSSDLATLAVSLESDSTADLATSATTHFTTSALAFADFSPAGTVLAAVRLPLGEYERYLGVRYTVASGPLTAGAFDAFLTKDVSAYRAYADNQPIHANARSEEHTSELQSLMRISYAV